MEQLIVVRPEWGRGDKANSSLYNSNTGLMCCLGFECIRRGFTQHQISGLGMPANLYRGLERLGPLVKIADNMLPSVNSVMNSDFALAAASINDADTYQSLVNRAIGINKENPEYKLPVLPIQELTTEEYREYLLGLLFAHHGIEVTFVD